MPQIKHIESDTLINVELPPVFKGGIWECGDQRFTDPAEELYETVIDATPPTVTVTHFLLLFSSDERVKARELRGTDKKMDDFWRIIEDPRLLEVHLSLPSVQNGIEYTLTAVKAAELTGLDITVRKGEILSGKLR